MDTTRASDFLSHVIRCLVIAGMVASLPSIGVAEDGSPLEVGERHAEDVQALTGYVQGEVALGAHDAQAAIMGFRRATRAHPEQPLAWLKLAEAYRMAHEFKEAHAALERAESKGALPWEVSEVRASIFRAQHQPDKVFEVYHTSDSNGAPATFFGDWLQYASLQKNELASRQAAAAYTRAHPEESKAWKILADVLSGQGYIKSSVGPYQRAASLPDGSALAGQRAARLLVTLDRPEEALRAATICVSKYRYHVGCYLVQVEAFDLAAKREISDLKPAAITRSIDEEVSSSLEEAIYALARMSSTTPTKSLRTGRLLSKRTTHAIAVQYARDIVKLRPYNQSLVEVAGWISVYAEAEEAAVGFFVRYLEMGGHNVSALNYVGYSYAEQGKHLPKAIEYLRRALEQKGDDPNIRDSLAWALFKDGQLSKALEMQQEVARELPRSAVVLDHLGDMLRAAGRVDEARHVWERALEHATASDEDVLETVPAKLRELE